MAKKRTIQYCVECGAKNKISDKKCSSCKEKLNPKDHALKDYLEEKVNGEVENKALELIKAFIKSHLYGTVFTCSILATVASVVINTTMKPTYIETVDSKPVVTSSTSYIGAGLSSRDVVLKYLFAMQENDVDTMQALRLETYYPSLRKSIAEGSYEKTGLLFDGPITDYEMSDHADVFFKNMAIGLSLTKSYEMVTEGNYGDYAFERWVFNGKYCGYNFCDTFVTLEDQDYFFDKEVIECIEVDGNFYINGEKSYNMNVSEYLAHLLLLKFEGDTSKFSFREILALPDDEICSTYGVCLE